MLHTIAQLRIRNNKHLSDFTYFFWCVLWEMEAQSPSFKKWVEIWKTERQAIADVSVQNEIVLLERRWLSKELDRFHTLFGVQASAGCETENLIQTGAYHPIRSFDRALARFFLLLAQSYVQDMSHKKAQPGRIGLGILRYFMSVEQSLLSLGSQQKHFERNKERGIIPLITYDTAAVLSN